MNIGAIGSGDFSQMPFQVQGQNGSDPMEDFAEKLTKKIMEMIDTNGDGLLSNAEFKIPEQGFQKADTDGNGLLSQEELKNGMMEKMEQLQSLISGNEGLIAEIQEKMKQMEESSEEEEYLVEIPFNGVDDDKDGEIDEDDLSKLLDTSNEEESSIDSISGESSNIFDMLM